MDSTKTSTTMSPEEEDFHQQLGERIAAVRGERGLTQVQLAEHLGVSQQPVLSFEKGRRRVPVSLLPLLAETLAVSIEHLLGQENQPAKARAHSQPKLQQQLERLNELPRSKQRFVFEMLDTVLRQARQ